MRYELATHHFQTRGSMKGSWCRTLRRPWMSSSPPGPIGVPVTAQRWVLCSRAAMTATLRRPVPTICASSKTTRHQLHTKTGQITACLQIWEPHAVQCSGRMHWQHVVLCRGHVLCCAVLCCAVLCCAVLCCAVTQCCTVQWPHTVLY